METLRIDIVNPKAKGIIQLLADLNLISIREKEPVASFQVPLTKLTSKDYSISSDEITRGDVGIVTDDRYEKGVGKLNHQK